MHGEGHRATIHGNGDSRRRDPAALGPALLLGPAGNL